MDTIYADLEIASENMFAVTPEGTYFTFEYPEYTPEHSDVIVVDPKSHKDYTVVFDE